MASRDDDWMTIGFPSKHSILNARRPMLILRDRDMPSTASSYAGAGPRSDYDAAISDAMLMER